MTLTKLSEKLYEKLQEQIRETGSIENPLEKLRSGLSLVQTALAELKIALAKSGFEHQQEEIWFFKTGKPRIYAMLIFVTERYAIENSMPIFGKKSQVLHLQTQISFINRFFRQNEFLYQYYRLKATDLDDRYFVRHQNSTVPGFAEVPDVDPSFSTIADYLFSKFIAYEELLVYLRIEIIRRGAPAGELPKAGQKNLKWTGESINVVELVYGIYETRQVNEGKATLIELMDAFSQAFQINLSTYFKRFSDIKRRKSMSKTRFLDEMQQLVSKRIEDSDAWIPDDQKSRYGY